MATTLTAVAVERIKPDPGKRLEVPDAALPSFYLVVQPSGAKSWAIRYRVGGRPRKHTIGSYPAVDLKRARELARAAIGEIASGGDPSTEKIARRRAEKDAGLAERDLVETQVEAFIERHARPNTRPASYRMTAALLRKNVVPAWGGRLVQDIGRREVVDLLDTVVDRGAPVMANRLLAATRRMFGWLRERGVVETNPCEGVRPPTAEKSRDRVLTDEELRLVWLASEHLGQPFGPMFRLLVLTGQRVSEVGGMSDFEIDRSSATWIIPKERAKNGVAHEVPLTEAAVVALDSVTRVSGDKRLVFSTTGETAASGYSKAKDRLDGEIARLAREQTRRPGGGPAEVVVPPWRVHDLRRTMASGMARLGVQLPVIEKLLNHVSGSFGGIVGVYQRHSFADEKRAALETWARHVLKLARVPR